MTTTIDTINEYLKKDEGAAAWINLGIAIGIAVVVVFVLLKLIAQKTAATK